MCCLNSVQVSRPTLSFCLRELRQMFSFFRGIYGLVLLVQHSCISLWRYKAASLWGFVVTRSSSTSHLWGKIITTYHSLFSYLTLYRFQDCVDIFVAVSAQDCEPIRWAEFIISWNVQPSRRQWPFCSAPLCLCIERVAISIKWEGLEFRFKGLKWCTSRRHLHQWLLHCIPSWLRSKSSTLSAPKI